MRKALVCVAITAMAAGCGPKRSIDEVAEGRYALWIDNRGGPGAVLAVGGVTLAVPADSVARRAVPVPARAQDAAVVLGGKEVGRLRAQPDVDAQASRYVAFSSYRSLVLDPTGARCYTGRTLKFASDDSKPIPGSQTIFGADARRPDRNLSGARLYADLPEIDYFIERPPEKLYMKSGLNIDLLKYAVQESGCPPPPTNEERMAKVFQGLTDEALKKIGAGNPQR